MSSGSSAPSHKIVPGTGFVVDAFKYPHPSVRAYFLSHAHSDHYTGLSEHWQHPVYCSTITGKLVVHLCGVNPDLIRPLPLNVPSKVLDVTVTLIDANHCPGAVQLLFKLPDGRRYIHSGDFRYDPSMQGNPHLQCFKGCSALFLDTTYCHPRFSCVPQQDDVVSFVARKIEELQAEIHSQKQVEELAPSNSPEHPEPSPGCTTASVAGHFRRIYLISTYVIGKERILFEVHKRCGLKIYVTDKKMAVLRCIGLDEEQLLATFTTDPAETPVHVVPWGYLADTFPFFRPNFSNMDKYRELHQVQEVIGFCPTGFNVSEMKQQLAGAEPACRSKGDVRVYPVAYSEHSTFTELLEYVRFLRPAKVVPTVGVNGKDSDNNLHAMLQHFSGLVDQTASKAAFLSVFTSTAPAAAGAVASAPDTADANAAPSCTLETTPAPAPAAASASAALSVSASGPQGVVHVHGGTPQDDACHGDAQDLGMSASQDILASSCSNDELQLLSVLEGSSLSLEAARQLLRKAKGDVGKAVNLFYDSPAAADIRSYAADTATRSKRHSSGASSEAGRQRKRPALQSPTVKGGRKHASQTGGQQSIRSFFGAAAQKVPLLPLSSRDDAIVLSDEEDQAHPGQTCPVDLQRQPEAELESSISQADPTQEQLGQAETALDASDSKNRPSTSGSRSLHLPRFNMTCPDSRTPALQRPPVCLAGLPFSVAAGMSSLRDSHDAHASDGAEEVMVTDVKVSSVEAEEGKLVPATENATSGPKSKRMFFSPHPRLQSILPGPSVPAPTLAPAATEIATAARATATAVTDAAPTTAKPMVTSPAVTESQVPKPFMMMPQQQQHQQQHQQLERWRDNLLLPYEQYKPLDHACWSQGHPAPYLHLALALQAMDATTKRTVIQNVLTNMFRSLLALGSSSEVIAALYLCTGRVSADHEVGGELGVGGASVSAALMEATGVSRGRMRELYRQFGDIGDVAEAVRTRQASLRPPPSLTITAVLHALRSLGLDKGQGAQGRRKEAVRRLLLACRGPEIKYLIRTLVQNLRVGANWRSVIGPLAMAVTIHRQAQARGAGARGHDGSTSIAKATLAAAATAAAEAYHVCPSFEVLVPALLDAGVEGLAARCGMTLGVPVKPMLARICSGISDGLRLLGAPACGTFLAEYKYDGIRAQIHLMSNGQVKVFSRNSEDQTAAYPDVCRLIRDAADRSAAPATPRQAPSPVCTHPAPTADADPATLGPSDGGPEPAPEDQTSGTPEAGLTFGPVLGSSSLAMLTIPPRQTEAQTLMGQQAAGLIDCDYSGVTLAHAPSGSDGAAGPWRSLVVDAEVVAVERDEGGGVVRLRSFQELSTRTRGAVQESEVSVPIIIFVFDLLWFDGRALLQLPLSQRRDLIPRALPGMKPGLLQLATSTVLDPGSFQGSSTRHRESELNPLSSSAHHHDDDGPGASAGAGADDDGDDGDDARDNDDPSDDDDHHGNHSNGAVNASGRQYDAADAAEVARGQQSAGETDKTAVGKAEEELMELLLQAFHDGSEGLMLKNLRAPYEPSRRSEAWIKIKRDYCEGLRDSLDLVVIGAWHGQGRKVRWLSPFLLACWDPDREEFQSVCRCMSGFSDVFYQAATERLKAQAIAGPKMYYNTSEQPSIWFEPTEVWEVRGADLTLSPVHKAAVGRLHPERGVGLRFPRFIQVRPDKSPQDSSSPDFIVELFNKQTRKPMTA